MPLSSQTQAVLAVLLSAPAGRHYGLEVAKEAGIATGTVYPILARLERMGWVVSEWESVDGARTRPRRRYYSLTGDGIRDASSELASTAKTLERAGVSFPAKALHA